MSVRVCACAHTHTVTVAVTVAVTVTVIVTDAHSYNADFDAKPNAKRQSARPSQSHTMPTGPGIFKQVLKECIAHPCLPRYVALHYAVLRCNVLNNTLQRVVLRCSVVHRAAARGTVLK